MIKKIISLLEEKSFLIPSLLLKNYRNLNITDSELIILIYLINSTDKFFNPKQISQNLKFTINEVLELITSLSEKGILKIDIVEKKIREEVIVLNGLYDKLAFLIINDKFDEKNTNIFDKIEQEFGRTLSPMDYEMINEWQEKYQDDLILAALKEATFNNVKNLKYIDRILNNWNQNGIKSKNDIEKKQKKFEKSDKKLFDYDWLNERDN